MKIEIKLLDIIRKAKFGSIGLGDSRSKVVQILGEPSEIVIPRLTREKLEVISYHGFEFTFHKNKLIMFMHKSILKWDLSIDPAFVAEHERFQLRSWSNNLEHDLRLESMRNHLKAYGIPYVEKPFFDSFSLLLRDDLELQFYSPLVTSRNPLEWMAKDRSEQKFRLGAIYCYKRAQKAKGKAAGFSGLGRIGYG